MMLTISTIFHVVKIIASLFAQQSKRLGASDVELLSAACFVALHTGSNISATSSSLFLANITRLEKIESRIFVKRVQKLPRSFYPHFLPTTKHELSKILANIVKIK